MEKNSLVFDTRQVFGLLKVDSDAAEIWNYKFGQLETTWPYELPTKLYRQLEFLYILWCIPYSSFFQKL